MTCHAIAPWRAVRFCEGRSVTSKTPLPEIGSGLNRRMRIVARSAPQLTAALARARTDGQLLCVADHFYCPSSRRRCDVNRKSVFQRLPGLIIRHALARIGNSNFSRQMTLLANAVARGRL